VNKFNLSKVSIPDDVFIVFVIFLAGLSIVMILKEDISSISTQYFYNQECFAWNLTSSNRSIEVMPIYKLAMIEYECLKTTEHQPLTTCFFNKTKNGFLVNIVNYNISCAGGKDIACPKPFTLNMTEKDCISWILLKESE